MMSTAAEAWKDYLIPRVRFDEDEQAAIEARIDAGHAVFDDAISYADAMAFANDPVFGCSDLARELERIHEQQRADSFPI
jgi:hypothetical protein